MLMHIKATLIVATSLGVIALCLAVPMLIVLGIAVWVISMFYSLVYDSLTPKAPEVPRTQEEIDRDIWNGYDH